MSKKQNSAESYAFGSCEGRKDVEMQRAEEFRGIPEGIWSE